MRYLFALLVVALLAACSGEAAKPATVAVEQKEMSEEELEALFQKALESPIISGHKRYSRSFLPPEQVCKRQDGKLMCY